LQRELDFEIELPKRPRRDKQIMTSWTAEEHQTIKDLAREYGVSSAGLVHDIVAGALKSLRNSEKD